MKIENIEENADLDASELLECELIYNPEDDSKDALFAGPFCAYGVEQRSRLASL